MRQHALHSALRLLTDSSCIPPGSGRMQISRIGRYPNKAAVSAIELASALVSAPTSNVARHRLNFQSVTFAAVGPWTMREQDLLRLVFLTCPRRTPHIARTQRELAFPSRNFKATRKLGEFLETSIVPVVLEMRRYISATWRAFSVSCLVIDK